MTTSLYYKRDQRS